MVPAFQTDRLHLLPALVLDADHSDLAAELVDVLTPTVLAPLPPSLVLPSSPNPQRDWVSARLADSFVHCVRERESQNLAGLLLLHLSAPSKKRRTLHLGYLFAQHTWGKGYATELLRGLVQTAQNLAPITLVGGVDASNRASARVLVKAGFAIDARQSTHDTSVYSLSVRLNSK